MQTLTVATDAARLALTALQVSVGQQVFVQATGELWSVSAITVGAITFLDLGPAITQVDFAVVDYYVNLSKPCTQALLISLASLSQLTTDQIVQSDKVKFRLWFATPNNNGLLVPSYFAPGTVITVGALQAFPIGAGELFACNTFAKQTQGPQVWYEAVIDLTTSQLAAALGNNASIQLLVSIKISDQPIATATQVGTVAYWTSTLLASPGIVGDVNLANLPTADPNNPGQLWQNGDVVMVSGGAGALPLADPHTAGQLWFNGGVLMVSQ